MRRVADLVYLTPAVVLRAMAIAAVVTLVMDLVFRALVRPMMVRWYHPTNRGESGRATGSTSCWRRVRRSSRKWRRGGWWGGRQRAGTLVRTSRRITFEPFAWDKEVVVAARNRVASVRAVTPRRQGSGDGVGVSGPCGD